MPLPVPAVVPLTWIVARVDLDVDEADPGAGKAATCVVDDVDDRTAGPARAPAGCREREDERSVGGQRLADGIAQQAAVRGNAGGQLRNPPMRARKRRSLGRIGLLADFGRRRMLVDDELGETADASGTDWPRQYV